MLLSELVSRTRRKENKYMKHIDIGDYTGHIQILCVTN
jgi:hypothetical protein